MARSLPWARPWDLDSCTRPGVECVTASPRSTRGRATRTDTLRSGCPGGLRAVGRGVLAGFAPPFPPATERAILQPEIRRSPEADKSGRQTPTRRGASRQRASHLEIVSGGWTTSRITRALSALSYCCGLFSSRAVTASAVAAGPACCRAVPYARPLTSQAVSLALTAAR